MRGDPTRRRPVIAIACLAIVILAILAAQPLLIDPLPDIARPGLPEPKAPQPGYGVLGQDWGYLAGINDHGNYIQAIGDAVSAQSQTLVGLLAGLVLVVGYVLQRRLDPDHELSGLEAGVLAVFILCAVASGYCAYRTHLAFLAQASEAVVYFDGLEAPLAAQAMFLLGAVAAAVALSCLELCARPAPRTAQTHTGTTDPARTSGQAPDLLNAADPTPARPSATSPDAAPDPTGKSGHREPLE